MKTYPTLALALALALSPSASASPPPPDPDSDPSACTDPSGVCVEGASYEPDTRLDDAARRKEAKRARKRKDVPLSITVTEGRASVFVDGVWIGPAPVQELAIKPGKHDIEVRDGEKVLATGLLKISTRSKDPVRVVVKGNPPPPPPPGSALE